MKRLLLVVHLLVLLLLMGCQGSGLRQGGMPIPSSLENVVTTRIGNMSEYGYTVIEDPTGRSPGAPVMRYELRNGDCSGADCSGAGKNRNGVYRERIETQYGPRGGGWGMNSTVWYGFDVYLAGDTAQQLAESWISFTTLGQIKSGKFSPRGGIVNAGQGHPLLTLTYQHGKINLHIFALTGDKSFSYGIMPIAEIADRWTRFEVQARWSRGTDGFVRLYVDGDLAVEFTGVTYVHGGERMEFALLKTGIYTVYKDKANKYANKVVFGEKAGLGPRVVLYDNVSLAKTREGLMKNRSDDH